MRKLLTTLILLIIMISSISLSAYSQINRVGATDGLFTSQPVTITEK